MYLRLCADLFPMSFNRGKARCRDIVERLFNYSAGIISHRGGRGSKPIAFL
jgi:hypothetical protein